MRILKFLSTTGSLVVIFSVFLVSKSCSVTGPLREDKGATSFQLGIVPAQWKAQEISEDSEVQAQRFYLVSGSGAWVSFNSVCDRYPDSTLESLSKQLLAPLAGATVTRREEKLTDSRNSLWTHAQGKIDGVPVSAIFVVLRKNSCIFDFTLTSKNKILSQDESDFGQWVSAFKYSGR
jgi:hypothetical protein